MLASKPTRRNACIGVAFVEEALFEVVCFEAGRIEAALLKGVFFVRAVFFEDVFAVGQATGRVRMEATSTKEWEPLPRTAL